ncbi:sodium channel protein Nach-like [Bombus impatiens]|uniref:Sodium channel protein Nach-like n=1 Tax=Bombus impatiens TaxID=132113 RepID=A0A6P3DWX9_BOMIM|nr:sodium channel protein Nach-like [Bombus impatiens]XP_033179583.1 sodium channel protein Nach-like [Bombus impatiens]
MSKFYGNNYDITDIMERLTPQCSSMLLNCYFRNQRMNCSDIFSVGKTKNGFCCIFNYIAESFGDAPKFFKQEEFKLYYVGDIGIQNGLTVTMDPLLDDYFYTILPTIGWKVMIFDPYDYPDSGSGSVSDILLGPLTEKYVSLKAVGLYSTDNIRPYSMQKRGCIFPDEYVSDHTTYTYNDCIVACKMEHVWNHCKCRVFFYPYHEDFNRTCNMENIHCLLQYYDVAFNIVPYKDNNLSSSLDDQNATMYCKNCYPECDDMRYYVQSTISNIEPGYFDTELFPDMNVTNHSVLHVYFPNSGTEFLKQDVTTRWYEYLGEVGGLYGLYVGISIISFVELIYFIILWLSEAFKSFEVVEEEIPRENAIHPIYWNEFFPHPRAVMNN